MPLRFSARRLACAGALAALAPPAVFAQPSPWAPPALEGPSLAIEVLRPFFDGDEGTLTGAAFLTLRAPVGRNLGLIVEAPFAGADDPGGSASDFAIGNPYVGVVAGLGPRVGVEAGVRLPLADSDGDGSAPFVGFLTDPDRFGAFVVNYVPLDLRATTALDLGGDAAIRLRTGATVLVPTEDGNDTEAALGYSAVLVGPAGPLQFGAGVSGLYIATEEGDVSFAESSGHQLGLTLDARAGALRPGVLLRVPLDGEDEVLGLVDAVVGLRLVGAF